MTFPSSNSNAETGALAGEVRAGTGWRACLSLYVLTDVLNTLGLGVTASADLR